VRAGVSESRSRSREAHSMIYGGRRNDAKAGRGGGRGLVTEETYRKSRYARPVYYVFDNRTACAARACDGKDHVHAGDG
jgi:hypothetical protein